MVDTGCTLCCPCQPSFASHSVLTGSPGRREGTDDGILFSNSFCHNNLFCCLNYECMQQIRSSLWHRTSAAGGEGKDWRKRSGVRRSGEIWQRKLTPVWLSLVRRGRHKKRLDHLFMRPSQTLARVPVVPLSGGRAEGHLLTRCETSEHQTPKTLTMANQNSRRRGLSTRSIGTQISTAMP